MSIGVGLSVTWASAMLVSPAWVASRILAAAAASEVEFKVDVGSSEAAGGCSNTVMGSVSSFAVESITAVGAAGTEG